MAHTFIISNFYLKNKKLLKEQFLNCSLDNLKNYGKNSEKYNLTFKSKNKRIVSQLYIPKNSNYCTILDTVFLN